jgi:hypothetical protein
LLLQAVPTTLLAAGSAPAKHGAYSEDEVAKGLPDVLEKVLKERGRPMAFIRGEEAGGGRKVYWQGPSIGFDVGFGVGYMHFSRKKRYNPF